MSRFLRGNRSRSRRDTTDTRLQTIVPRGIRGRGRGSFQGRGGKILIEPHRHPGIFIAKSKEDMLVTKNLVPGMDHLN